jgi:CubicO group peptidase (beta-lactamase class C family)
MKPPEPNRTRAGHAHLPPILLPALFGFGLAWSPSVNVTAQPTISTDPRSQFAWEGKRVTLNVTANGTSPLGGYRWQFGGTNIADATNRSLVFPQVQLTNDGNYRVVVTDATGATTSQMAQVLVRRWPEPTGPRIPELARLDTNMQTVLLNFGIPGGSLAVVKDGRLVFARGYGWADVERDEPFHPDSRCQLASLSKTITAAMVMKLVENGKLDLSSRAFSLLNLEPPEYPGAFYDSRLMNITVRQLLNHTAGWNWSTAKNPLGGTGFDPAFWPDWTMQDLDLNAPATPMEFVRWIMGKPLQENPGSQAQYSNVGYIVAGRVVEKITGQAFETVARQLFAEAGITRVQLSGNTLAERLPGEVVYYLHPAVTAADIVGPGNWAQPKPVDFNLPYAYPVTTIDAAGGFIASAIDHARFVAAIDGLPTFPDILTTNSVKTMASGPLGWDSWATRAPVPKPESGASRVSSLGPSRERSNGETELFSSIYSTPGRRELTTISSIASWLYWAACPGQPMTCSQQPSLMTPGGQCPFPWSS